MEAKVTNVKEIYSTVKVSPDIWEHERHNVTFMGDKSIQRYVEENNLKLISGTSKHEIIKTVIVTDFGYSEYPGELTGDNIAWYEILFTQKAYEPLEFKVEIK